MDASRKKIDAMPLTKRSDETNDLRVRWNIVLCPHALQFVHVETCGVEDFRIHAIRIDQNSFTRDAALVQFTKQLILNGHNQVRLSERYSLGDHSFVVQGEPGAPIFSSPDFGTIELHDDWNVQRLPQLRAEKIMQRKALIKKRPPTVTMQPRDFPFDQLGVTVVVEFRRKGEQHPGVQLQPMHIRSLGRGRFQARIVHREPMIDEPADDSAGVTDRAADWSSKRNIRV